MSDDDQTLPADAMPADADLDGHTFDEARRLPGPRSDPA